MTKTKKSKKSGKKEKKQTTHLAGKTVADSCSVASGFKIVVTGALMVTVATLTTPVAAVVMVLPSASVAVMTEPPLPRAARRPSGSTDTRLGFELDQVVVEVG